MRRTLVPLVLILACSAPPAVKTLPDAAGLRRSFEARFTESAPDHLERPLHLVMERRANGWKILHDHTSSD